MKRGGPIKRRTPVNRSSAKHDDYQREYWKRSVLVHNRSRGRCEIRAAHDCDGLATDTPHHRKLRSQGGTNSLDNLLDTCFSGHVWVHRILHYEEAVRLQLIIPRETPITPYSPEDLP